MLPNHPTLLPLTPSSRLTTSSAGAHLPATPLKSPAKGWKVHADPHATAPVGKLLPTWEALKPERPGSVGQALPNPRAQPQDLLFRRPPFQLKSRRPPVGNLKL